MKTFDLLMIWFSIWVIEGVVVIGWYELWMLPWVSGTAWVLIAGYDIWRKMKRWRMR